MRVGLVNDQRLYEKRKSGLRETDRPEEERHVKTEAETGVIQPLAKGCQQLPESGRDREAPPLEAQESRALRTPWVQLPAA